MASKLLGIAYILGAIYVAIYIFKNRNKMPCSVQGLNKESYSVADKLNFNKIMIIQDTLACALVFLSGVLCIITDGASSAVALPGFMFFIYFIFAKVAKKFITMK